MEDLLPRITALIALSGLLCANIAFLRIAHREGRPLALEVTAITFTALAILFMTLSLVSKIAEAVQ